MSQEKSKLIKNFHNHDDITKYGESLHKKSQVHFLSLIKLYSDHSITVISNNNQWVKLIIKRHTNIESLYSRLSLGKNRWNITSNIDIVQARIDSAKKFNLVGIKDIVKVSMHEVGCYEIYTFGLHDVSLDAIDDIYKDYNNMLLHFVANMSRFYGNILAQYSAPEFRISLFNSNKKNKENLIAQWLKDYDHLCDKLGHNYNPNYT